MATNVNFQSLSTGVADLLRYALEDEIPFKLRCRASMKAMVSKYGNPAAAEHASPAPNAADVTLVFQVSSIAPMDLKADGV